MRIFTTRGDAATDPQALWAELLRRAGTASSTPDLVKRLNPHLNFDRDIPAGSVLFVPEAADTKAGAGTAVGTEDLTALLSDVDAALAATRQRVRSGLAQRDADHAAVAAALKPAAAKRLVDSDPSLKQQLEAADAAFKADQKQAAETESQLAEAHKLAMGEFALLRKLLAG